MHLDKSIEALLQAAAPKQVRSGHARECTGFEPGGATVCSGIALTHPGQACSAKRSEIDRLYGLCVNAWCSRNQRDAMQVA